MTDLARDFDSPTATGTRWEVHCPCGREHHYARPVVSVGSLNDARARLVELAAENERLREAQAAARAFAEALRSVAAHCYCQPSGQACDACRPAHLALAFHSGWLPETEGTSR